jgi:uncharacterized protein
VPETAEATHLGALTPRVLADAFTFATEYLGVHIDEVNALNVYPVPDGDTGTNMHLTLQSVRRQLHDEAPTTMADVCHALAYGSLLGARGNSGVILSQVLKGFADVAKGFTELDARALSEALTGATKSAYAAVMKPVEGTILTVVRESGEAAAEAADGVDGPLELLRACSRPATPRSSERRSCSPSSSRRAWSTPAALGYLRTVEGDRRLPRGSRAAAAAQGDAACAAGLRGGGLRVLHRVPALERRRRRPARSRTRSPRSATRCWSSVRRGFVKGHIHTEEPEKLLALVGRYGTMVRSKVEDMSEQHSEILADVDMEAAEPPKSGLVAVSSGYGLTKVFRSLGARVVGGGQTDNPSVQDIADAVRSLGAPRWWSCRTTRTSSWRPSVSSSWCRRRTSGPADADARGGAGRGGAVRRGPGGRHAARGDGGGGRGRS